MEQSGLTIRAFGPMEVITGGQAIRVRTSKDLKLLAYLLYRHDSELHRTDIARLFWHEGQVPYALDDGRCRTLLAQTLSKLSLGLGHESWRLKKPTPQTLLLDTTGADIDFSRWHTAIHTLNAEALEHAARLYQRGRFLDGWEDAWIQDARLQIEGDYREAWERVAQRALDRGDKVDAQRYLQQAMEISPWNQALWRKTMQAMSSDRQHRALDLFYDALQNRCAQQDRALEAETQNCFLMLRRTAKHFEDSPESGNLPHPPSRFVAREADIREVSAIVGTNRLTTLTGPGGIGKTRLALEVARHVRENYYHRAWLVDLSGVTEETFVAQQAALDLGIPARAGWPYERAVWEALRFKRMLLVFDNCEHLVHACARFCEQLLNHCADITILATSREALRIAGEAVWSTPPLAFPTADRAYSPLELAELGAVQLFVSRASSPQYPLILDSTNAFDIAAICRHLSGLPLGIELAAARVNRKVGSVHAVADGLHQSLQILTLGSRTAPERQQTLQTAIDWSYKLLTPLEKHLFTRLGVFHDFTVEAATEVCSDTVLPPHAVADTLFALVEKSLVERHSSGAFVRYRLSAPIREFCLLHLSTSPVEYTLPSGKMAQQTAADEWTPLQQRRGEYLLKFARQAEPYLNGSRQIEWLDRLQAETANFHAALEWTWQSADFALGLCMAGSLWRFWYIRGHHQEGLRWLSRLLDAQPKVSVSDRLKALTGAGNIAYAQREYATARRFYEESLALKSDMGDAKAMHTGIASLANALAGEKDYARAGEMLDQCLQFFQETADTRNIALTLTNLGAVAHKQQNYQHARECHAQSLTLFRTLGDFQNIALALNNLAETQLRLKAYGDMRPLLTECFALCQKMAIRHRVPYCLVNFMRLAIALGNDNRAAKLYGALEAYCQAHSLFLPDETAQEVQKLAEDLSRALGEVEFRVRTTQGQAMDESALAAYIGT